jgi:hypothetical protein
MTRDQITGNEEDVTFQNELQVAWVFPFLARATGSKNPSYLKLILEGPVLLLMMCCRWLASVEIEQ